jgi:cyclophilin family peptidyl-prolyl cis-trans isomerase
MKNSTLANLIVVLLIPVGALLAYNRNSAATTTTTTSSSTPNPSNSKGTTAVQSPTPGQDPADVVSASKVILKTNKGDITLNLFPADAPKTVKNFATLGKRGYYTGVIFHRIIKSFMIQGGDPTGTGSGGESIYGSRFVDEINAHKIVKGTLAMANAGPNTNGSQFFIVTESDQTSLDGHYTAFGQVADDASQKVVQDIAAVPVNGERPVDDVRITGFDIVQ